MEDPKSRKGKNGLKKDQKIKAHADRLGSSKHIRLKEQMLENKLKNKKEPYLGLLYLYIFVLFSILFLRNRY
jgi:hypothetical protein